MKKIVFFSLLILFFLYKTQNVFAYQDAFTVDKIIIEGKIKQNNYKEKFINVAFRMGFEKLLSNILKIEDQKKIFSTELAIIKSLVQSYRIVEEQEIEGKYRAEISLSFKELISFGKKFRLFLHITSVLNLITKSNFLFSLSLIFSRNLIFSNIECHMWKIFGILKPEFSSQVTYFIFET